MRLSSHGPTDPHREKETSIDGGEGQIEADMGTVTLNLSTFSNLSKALPNLDLKKEAELGKIHIRSRDTLQSASQAAKGRIDCISCKSKKSTRVVRSTGHILHKEKQNLFLALEKFQESTQPPTSCLTKVFDYLGLTTRQNQDTVSMKAEKAVTQLLELPEILDLPDTYQTQWFWRRSSQTAPSMQTIATVTYVAMKVQEFLSELGAYTGDKPEKDESPLTALYKSMDDATHEYHRAERETIK